MIISQVGTKSWPPNRIIFTPTSASKNQPTERKYFDQEFQLESQNLKWKHIFCEGLPHEAYENPSGVGVNTRGVQSSSADSYGTSILCQELWSRQECGKEWGSSLVSRSSWSNNQSPIKSSSIQSSSGP